MPVLIIGGTSFIGPHVVRSLVSGGHEVTVFHRGEHEPELPKGVRHVHSESAAFPVLEFPPELLGFKVRFNIGISTTGLGPSQYIREAA